MVLVGKGNSQNREFENLLDQTISYYNKLSISKKNKLLNLSPNEFELHFCETLSELAKSTHFNSSVKLISGHKFPDVIVDGTNYGIEIKTTKQNHWITTGNSVLESTRIEGVSNIYLFFAKLVKSPEFKWKKYEDCLVDIVVTHYPRYKIDMDANTTIFDKLSVSYESLRKDSNPIKYFREYYRDQLKPGEELWWLDSDQEELKSSNIKIQSFSNLSQDEKSDIISKAFILFPEICSRSSSKFSRFSAWCIKEYAIYVSSARDSFSAGGTVTLTIEDQIYKKAPRIIQTMHNNAEKIETSLNEIEPDTLSKYWSIEQKKIENRKFDIWRELVSENLNQILTNSPFNPITIINHIFNK